MSAGAAGSPRAVSCIVSVRSHPGRRRFRTPLLILLCAVIHFALLWLAIANAFVIFRGPSTPWEIFWDRTASVLMFPASLVYEQIHNGPGQLLIMIANSFLWGSAVAIAFAGVKQFSRKER
jgi:hypothetical protein